MRLFVCFQVLFNLTVASCNQYNQLNHYLKQIYKQHRISDQKVPCLPRFFLFWFLIIAVQKFQRFDWLQGVQLIINNCVTKENIFWGPVELQNAQNSHGNLICLSRYVICTFLCKQKQKQTLPQKWKKYCTADVLIFSKAEMNIFYIYISTY